MIHLSPNTDEEKERKSQIIRIRTLIEQELGSDAEAYLIKVMQLDHCPDPECESIETLIILLKENAPPFQFRFSCLMSDIKKETLSDLFVALASSIEKIGQ